ncbi:chemotaxis response regulator protein-glutamate methylesterase [Geobacter sp. SVR]|uniref:protein-glutamate methylesterase/protein-glutamine glutaminase n=1 Tax=Geobacter sp. SVR TaxID=2495594 RepID=UPI00143EF8F2|nr:chemotaxis response regulator protein-glutamate methylesterase [Geobacter sp. SVR]BCS52682.1 chemotaxis response regulator protein-glutamate methylesterase 1 [Geobacter sp. SVR]GCF86823.1 chemotaxis response regulator protein-glutamate methylesterase 1 [Geobacter sp. SVR]
MGSKIKVLVIDDSAVIRAILTEILNEADDIEVVGSAADPIFAKTKITSLQPDVITLDVEMPRMDGLTFLDELMHTDPLPVVMVSSLTQKSCDTTLRALELGAVDYVTKPTVDISEGIADLAGEIVRKVRIAAKARIRRQALPIVPPAIPIARPFSALDTRRMATTDKLIAIGASTGGTQALTEVIMALPASVPGVVIVQHMPPLFTKSFAKRLNEMARVTVKEAEHGDRISRGTVYVAPGGKHMSVSRSGAMYHIELSDGPAVNFVKPAVDVLFRSVAKYAGKNAVGVILTGMGEDGARGLKEMREHGALTFAQDEASCVVFGMPKKAIEMGAVDRILPLNLVTRNIMDAV